MGVLGRSAPILDGSGFTGTSSVAFHGTLASSFTVDSDSQFTAVVPQGATSRPITVTSPGASATSSGSFSVTPPLPPTTTTTTAYDGRGLAESVNGTLSYLLSDPTLGSASASVNLSGAVTATQLYSPYGPVRYTSGVLPTDYGFTHQRADAATGLDYDHARYYDPVAGQFVSADTTLAGGLYRYAYVAGNPETLVDPTGAYAQACDTSQCGTELPMGATGSSDSGEGGGVTTKTPPKVENDVETDAGTEAPFPAGRSGIVALLVGTLVLVGLNQQTWQAWVRWQAQHPEPGTVGRTDTTSGSGPSYTRSQTNALDAAQAAGGGNGGSGGSGTVPRTPPPTENGEAIGFGAPILAEDVLSECNPQLPTAQYCIGWTRWQAAFVPSQKWFNSEHALTNG